jgi:hypothetical protein
LHDLQILVSSFEVHEVEAAYKASKIEEGAPHYDEHLMDL